MQSVPPLMLAAIRSLPATPAMRLSRRIRLIEKTSLLLPVAGMGLGAWCALSGEGSTRQLGLTILGSSVAAMLARWQLSRWFSEKPRYEVESLQGDFEVRQYAPRIQAETVLNAAPWKQSLKEGFDRLAKYVFGDNSRRTKIPMTTPVLVTVGATDRATRTVAFKMPDSEPFETLPAPNDRQITLRRIPARRVAALCYSGPSNEQIPAEKRKELLTRVRAAGLLPIGEVTFAGFDAPWTLPWLRHNEVQVELSTLRGLPHAHSER
ncbi:MAG TPA: heme-binding protein [Polyangiaceae bacterium]|nr:heme-binding protein [Polyangiaceae bacterium]